MLPVSEANYFCVVEIDDTVEPDNGVLLLSFYSRLTCGACLFSGGGMCIALAPCLSGGVCGYA